MGPYSAPGDGTSYHGYAGQGPKLGDSPAARLHGMTHNRPIEDRIQKSAEAPVRPDPTEQRGTNWTIETCLRLFLIGVAALALGPEASLRAGELSLKNGLVLSGKVRRLQGLTPESVRHRDRENVTLPFAMVENGYQRIFVPRGQVARLDERDELGRFETFTLRQHKTGTRVAAGQVMETTPFDEYGHRRHTLATAQGSRELVVGVTKINPQYVAVTGIDCQWDYGIATSSVPPEQLDAMIRRVSDPKNPDHRFAIARFYLQAGLYEESGRELQSIAKDFPELAARVGDARKELKDFEHRLIVQELGRRKAAGQHELAHTLAQALPQDEASASVQRDVKELLHDYEQSHERGIKLKALLAELQARLDDPALVNAVMPMRSVVEEQLSIESLERLQAFFNLADDMTLKPSEKLALAYSGWVVGSASAVTDLGLAIRLWQAQHAILEYLRADSPQDRKDRLTEIAGLDGVNPEMVLKLIRCLPPVIDTVEVRPGEAGTLSLPGRDGDKRVSYGVLLPPEYDWRHRYPMVVALHPAEHSIKAELSWWGGTSAKPGLAQKRGYIVIAPEYAEGERKYNYSMTAHDAVLRAVTDARRRFNVDSDRVFLSGHGMGGDAAFDIGMSHPDQFAGVIPMNGICDAFCRWYTKNAGRTHWYVITGEYDGRDPFNADSTLVGRMMRQGMDVVLVEFLQRGAEPYFEEAPRVFEWMEPLRREKPPRDFQMSVLRASESRFYWLRADGLPASILEPVVLAGPSRGPVHPMLFGGKITPGNTIYLTSGAKSHTIWLSPDLINFSKRVTVSLRASERFRGMVHPSVEAILDDYRLRADRQVLYTARIEIN